MSKSTGTGMTSSKTELGKFIRARRLSFGLKQNSLAMLTRMLQGTISLLEIGHKKYLSCCQIEKLASVLRCGPEDLYMRMPKKHFAQPKTELGKLIQSRRQEIGLTFDQLAKKLRVSRSCLRQLEVKNQYTQYKLAKRLANVLDLAPSVLAKFVRSNRKPTSSELGQLIQTRRKMLMMTIEQLAEKLHVTKQFVNQIELGQCPLSQKDELVKRLAKVLKSDADELQIVRLPRKLKQINNAPTPLGRFLAERRSALHLTQKQLGERAEISEPIVCGLERGRIYSTPGTRKKIAKALDCQIPPELIPELKERHFNNEPGFLKVRNTDLGKSLTTRRLELRLRQAQVAQQAKTQQGVISQIERGTYPRRLKPLTLMRISEALQCTIPADFFPRSKSHSPEI